MSSVDAIAAAVAATLEGAKTRTEAGQAFSRVVEGRARGLRVTVRCSWSNRQHSWTVEAKGASPPVLVDVRRRVVGEQGAIDSGAIVAVPTGDAEFDREWLVEGAPADTTRLVVDAAVRTALAAAGDVTVEVDDGRVLAEGGGRGFYEAAEVVRTIEAVVAVRERLAALARERVGEATRAQAEQEIAALRAKQDRVFARASWPARVAIVVGAAALVTAVLAFFWGSCVPSR